MNTEIDSLLHWIRAFSDWGMFIVIWWVQLRVYPSFRTVESKAFVGWHKRYMRQISWLVGPLMIGQLLSGAVLAFADTSLSHVVYLALVAATWILTGFVAAPLHRKLQDRGSDPSLISRLIAWNWPRTVLWTAVVFV